MSDSETDSGCKPNGYIVLCRIFHTAQSQIEIPILTANYRNGIGIRIRIWIYVNENKPQVYIIQKLHPLELCMMNLRGVHWTQNSCSLQYLYFLGRGVTI